MKSLEKKGPYSDSAICKMTCEYDFIFLSSYCLQEH